MDEWWIGSEAEGGDHGLLQGNKYSGIQPEVLREIMKIVGEIWGSHGGKYEDGCLLGCSAV
jgi:hypothetical protein